MLNETTKAEATISFTVLGGYLGAGKTTLLNRLLNDNQGLRLALLINDFGAINIDANLIERQTDQQINLTNGCVCCGLTDGFDAAIEQLSAAATPPDHIVIEASGVADVHSLAQYGKAPGLSLNAVVVVADATSVQQKSRDKYVATTVKRQLAAADLLLLNKIDLVDAQRSEALRSWLAEINSTAPVINTQYCEVPRALLLGTGELSNSRLNSLEASTKSAAHAPHETYETWNFQSNERLSREQTEAMLSEFPEEMLRGKGFIATPAGLLEWHKVGRYQRLTEAVSSPLNPKTPQSTTELVAIGLKGQLPVDALTETALKYLG